MGHARLETSTAPLLAVSTTTAACKSSCDSQFASYSNYGQFTLSQSGGRQAAWYNGFGQMIAQGDSQIASIAYLSLQRVTGCERMSDCDTS